MRLRTLSLLALIVATVPVAVGRAGAEQLDAPFGEVVDVELVLVDVVAETGDGAPVMDLDREDFRLFEDCESVEISQFAATAVE